MSFDPEIIAMNKIGKILDKLPDDSARERVSTWVVSKTRTPTPQTQNTDNNEN